MPKSHKNVPPTITGQPVPGFPLSFTWFRDEWEALFDEQTALVKSDVARARAEDRLVVYLSCPISARGGGSSETNVDIARYVERALLQRWGEAFWILNPAQYQLESKAGTGLLDMHAKRLGIDLAKLLSKSSPGGGDYLRMWTKVLVEDGGDNLGRLLDAFYFLGPRDVHSFFLKDGSDITITAGIEIYFARKFSSDASFCDSYSVPGIRWGVPPKSLLNPDPRVVWTQRRKDFMRFYGLRASANFSLGSHDEWAILRLLNGARRKKTATSRMVAGDVGDQIAAFFDGNQVDPASSEAPLSAGYAMP